MSQMIDRGKEWIRINPQDPSRLEYSIDGGRIWHQRYSGSSHSGEFLELTDNGKEILAQTTEGLFYSIDEGRIWQVRRREKISSSRNPSPSSSRNSNTGSSSSASRNASGSSSTSESSSSGGGGGSGSSNGIGCCGLVVFLIIFIVYAAISGDLPEIAAGVFQLVKNLLATLVENLKEVLPSPSAGE